MSKLYKETKELMEMRKSMEADDIPEEAIRDTLLANAGEFENKAVALYQAGDEIDYDIQILDAMISDLQSRKVMLKKRKESMRNILLDAMQTIGVSQIACPFFTLSTKKTPQTVVIDVEADIPDEYVETMVVNKVDKKAVGAALKEGKDVPGAHLSAPGVTLQMRKK